MREESPPPRPLVAPTPLPTTGAGRVPFRVGAVLRRSLGFLGRRWPLVLVATVLLHAPVAWWALRVWRGNAWHPWFTLPVSLLNPILLALALVLQAAVAHAVYRDLAGRPCGIVGSLAGLRRLPAVLGVALLVGLALAIVVLVGTLLGAPLLVHPLHDGPELLLVRGLLALLLAAAVVTMLMVVSAYAVAVQAAVVEEGSPVPALLRSARLTRGRRWQLLALLLLPYGAQFGGMALLGWAYGAFDHPSERVAVVLLYALQAAVSAVHAVLAAVAYHDLRREREGIGVEDLLRVFQ